MNYLLYIEYIVKYIICIFAALLLSELNNILLLYIPLTHEIFSQYIVFPVFNYIDPYYAENYYMEQIYKHIRYNIKRDLKVPEKHRFN